MNHQQESISVYIKNLFSEGRLYSALSIVSIVVFSIIPLFFNFPFRDNSYLAWEGAYRMYKGQMPFIDFGIPLGYGFWLLPTLSFYIFGPYFISLVKIQVFINIVSGVTFKSIADLFVSNKIIVFLSVFLYCLTFIFLNFWPWYNHVVIVYHFIGLYFLLFVIIRSPIGWKKYLYLFLSAFFIFLAIFTKQDAGGLALLMVGAIILYDTLISRRFDILLVFSTSFIGVSLLFILPLLDHDFLYWFNYGQDHHNSRINLMDFASVILGESEFLKLYFLIMVIILSYKIHEDGFTWVKTRNGLFTLIVLCILFEASILQVTSYIPGEVNIFFHSFFVLFALNSISNHFKVSTFKQAILLSSLIFFWWSGYYWKYSIRIFSKILPNQDKENVVSISSWTSGLDTGKLDQSSWGYSDEEEFRRIRMPQETINAIEKLKVWRGIESGEIKVLNMSELTPLANILDFELEKGTPLWYHLNVGMFERELNFFLNRIDNNYYDIVIFEYLPGLNNFYPFAVRDRLQEKYKLQMVFQAPRDYKAEKIEIYQPKNAKTEISKLDQLPN